MRSDPFEQYYKAYSTPDSNSPTQTTWLGHGEAIETQQQGLRNAIRRAEAAGCYNYNPNAWSWATGGPPTKPAPK